MQLCRADTYGEGQGLTQSGRFEWLTFVLIGCCYGLWALALMAWTTSFWWLGLLLLPWLAAFHTSLQHETIHGHPTRWNWLNELLVSLPLGGVFPYRRYKQLHLVHHNDMNLTDPYEDPESFFWPLANYNRMRPVMKKLFEINNTFSGRLVVGPALTIIGFLRTEIQRLYKREPGVRLAWVLHLIGMTVLLVLVTQTFKMPLWIYLLATVYPALSITSIRSYAEHQAAENVGGRSAVVEAAAPWGLLFLNNNLHIVHHANPKLPWYEIPELYEERKKQFLASNENTLFHGYSDVARRFAFRVKQPVHHPFLHLEETVVE